MQSESGGWRAIGVLRLVASIAVGYLLYALSSMALVGWATTQDGLVVVSGSALALALIGGLAGGAARALAGARHKLASWILAGLIAAANLVNLLLATGAEPVWYKAATLLTVLCVLMVGLRERSGRH